MAIKFIHSRRLKKILQNEKWFILDIRPPDDNFESHIAGSLNIYIEMFFMPKILGVFKKIPEKKKILVVTRNGRNYMRLVQTLNAHGCNNVFVLKNGYESLNKNEPYIESKNIY